MSDLGPRLPQAYLEEIFQGPILDDLYDDLQQLAVPVAREQRPELVMVVGQPGAGAAVAHLQFIQGDYMHPAGIAREGEHPDGIVSIDLESYRTYHPDYEKLRRTRPQDLHAATDADTLWWQNRAADYVRARRYNVLIERDWDGADPVLLTAERFAGAGYDVRVAALAVPAAMSRLVLVESFTRQAEASGSGRWTSAERHDAGYAATAQVLQRAEQSEAVSRVTVHSRDGIVHDKQREPNGRWPARSPGAVGVLSEVREAVLPRAQRTALANRLTTTLQHLERAGVAHLALYEMSADLAQDLAGAPQTLDGKVIADLTTAMGELASANAALDMLDPPDPGPDIGTGPELEPPELGPDV